MKNNEKGKPKNISGWRILDFIDDDGKRQIIPVCDGMLEDMQFHTRFWKAIDDKIVRDGDCSEPSKKK
jgi:hypothetical protein